MFLLFLLSSKEPYKINIAPFFLTGILKIYPFILAGTFADYCRLSIFEINLGRLVAGIFCDSQILYGRIYFMESMVAQTSAKMSLGSRSAGICQKKRDVFSYCRDNFVPSQEI